MMVRLLVGGCCVDRTPQGSRGKSSSILQHESTKGCSIVCPSVSVSITYKIQQLGNTIKNRTVEGAATKSGSDDDSSSFSSTRKSASASILPATAAGGFSPLTLFCTRFEFKLFAGTLHQPTLPHPNFRMTSISSSSSPDSGTTTSSAFILWVHRGSEFQFIDTSFTHTVSGSATVDPGVCCCTLPSPTQ